MSELPSKYKAYLKLKKRMAGYAGAFTKKLRASLASRNNIAFGKLQKSVRTRVRDSVIGGERVLGLETVMLNYGEFLNRNIHPKTMPNVDAIIVWMKQKKIKPHRNKRGRYMSYKQAAYLIARAIQKRGFATYNNHQIGWADIVAAEEFRRLRKRSQADLRTAVSDLTLQIIDGVKKSK
mgnify:FL=1|tara:strand:+ start:1784 stop:2320 length:537 start_codon:yes stop_codon:yes gene_type:complete